MNREGLKRIKNADEKKIIEEFKLSNFKLAEANNKKKFEYSLKNTFLFH